MPKYENGVIYKLVNGSTEDVYYGSSCNNLNCRKSQHKHVYKKYLVGEHHYCSSFDLFDPDINDVEIEVVENYPCDTKQQLLHRERYYIENFPCVNRQVPIRTKTEQVAIDKVRYRNFYQANRDKMIAKVSAWRASNPDKVKAYTEKSNAKVTCECGATMAKRCLKRHKQSETHRNTLSAMN